MNQTLEFCVMWPEYSTTKPHRGPYMLREAAQHWVDGTEADGFESAIFEVWERPFFPWVKSDVCLYTFAHTRHWCGNLSCREE